MTYILLAGNITHLSGAMDEEGPACLFRIGNVRCRARADLALRIAQYRGYPGHQVEVRGELLQEGTKMVLAIQSLSLIN